MFLTRYDDSFRVFLDAHRQAGLDIVITTILHRIFDGGSRLGIKLHLIEDDERLTLQQSCAGLYLK